MNDHVHQELSFLKPADLVTRPEVVTLQEEMRWTWGTPKMILDLSSTSVAPDLSMPVVGVHATYASSFSRQYLFGFHHLHALISPEGEFNCQEINNYDGRLNFYVGNLPPPDYVIPDIRKHGDGFSVSFDRLVSKSVEHLLGFTFFGSPIEPENWGMWLLNGLLSAFSYVAAGQPGRYLCYAPRPWQRHLLHFIGIRPDRIVQQAPWKTYFCEHVTMHQYSHIDLIPDTISKSIFRNIVIRCAHLAAHRALDKIFISRRSITAKLGGKYRALVNEDQLISALEARGYIVVEPELLPFEEQVLLFNNARVIVGLGGAAMFNAIFCKPGTKVISIESTGAFALNHARMFSALELDYGFIFGRENSSDNNYPHNSWTLDVEPAVSAIVAFE